MILKIDNTVGDVELRDESGNYIYTVDKLKALALDTINWQAGQNVKKVTTQVGLSSSNSKAIALLAKLLAPSDTKLSKLTDKERSAWDKLSALADGGYADSDALNNVLEAVTEAVQDATTKSVAVMQAKSVEEIEELMK